MSIIEFIQDRLTEDEQWARICSLPHAENEPELLDGVHWRWVAGPEEDEIILPNPADDDADGMLSEHGTLAWLVTRETWPAEGLEESVPGGYSEGIHGMDGPAAAHIARHDPARVLAEVSAKRALLEMVLADQNSNGGKNSTQWNQVMRLLALPYRDHPQYRKSWAPR